MMDRLLWLALGVLAGWAIFGESKRQAALGWAVRAAQECEAKGTQKVSDCLTLAVDKELSSSAP